MKLTRQTLKRIIKEELDKVMNEEELDEGLFDFFRRDKGEDAGKDPGIWKMSSNNDSIEEIGIQLINNIREYMNRYKGNEEGGKWILDSLEKGDISFCEAWWMAKNGLAYDDGKAKSALLEMSRGKFIGANCGRESRPAVAGGKQLAYTIQELYDIGLKSEKGKKGQG